MEADFVVHVSLPARPIRGRGARCPSVRTRDVRRRAGEGTGRPSSDQPGQPATAILKAVRTVVGGYEALVRHHAGGGEGGGGGGGGNEAQLSIRSRPAAARSGAIDRRRTVVEATRVRISLEQVREAGSRAS